MTALTAPNPLALRHAGSLAAHLELGAGEPAEPTQRHTLRASHRRVMLPVLAAAAALALWSHFAPLAGAVVATGQVQAEFGRKTVQHQEGGIVQSLLVRPGQVVRAGEALLVVGDLRSDAALALLHGQRAAEQLRAARARAELALAATVAWPAELENRADGAAGTDRAQALSRERQLFDARRHALDEQLAAQSAQQGEARARDAALRSQLDAADRAAALARDELELNRTLVADGFIQKTRLMAFERGVAELDGRAAAIRAQLAEARTQAAALAQARAQARSVYQQRAADEQQEAGTRLRDIEERLRPGADLAARQTVRAPVDGTVMALRVGAVGSVVGPREPLLEIAPAGESLLIEVPVDPHDIDQVRTGGAAEVRLSAFDARRTPLLAATVRSLSPDVLTDAATRRSSYLAQVEVAPAELARHRDLHLQAGMPAEVFITTAPRSLFDYLLEPLGLAARRGLREP